MIYIQAQMNNSERLQTTAQYVKLYTLPVKSFKESAWSYHPWINLFPQTNKQKKENAESVLLQIKLFPQTYRIWESLFGKVKKGLQSERSSSCREYAKLYQDYG